MRFLLILVLFFLACQSNAPKEVMSNDSAIAAPARVSSVLQSDTLVITGKSAVIYTDTIKMQRLEKELGRGTFQVGLDDYAYYIQQGDQFLQSKKLPVIYAETKKYLKFTGNNGKVNLVKTDTLAEYAGIFLFDPFKAPKLVDITDIETEYAEYFK